MCLTGELGDGGAEGGVAGVHSIPDDLAVGDGRRVDQAGVPPLELVVQGPRQRLVLWEDPPL